MSKNAQRCTVKGIFIGDGLMMGIDLGSSFFKAEIFDINLGYIGGANASVVYNGEGGCAEMPVANCENTLREAIAGAIKDSGCAPDDISAVALTSQAQTFTVRSSEGRAKMPFISWRDNRSLSSNPAEALHDFGKHCSMTECLPALTVSKLAGMQGMIEGDDLLLWLPTWFVMELTGRAAVDVNLAAMSGLYSLQSGGWWQDAIKLCGVMPRNLPDLIPLGDVAGLTTDLAARYGLPPGIPVVLAGNDQSAGAYSAGIHESGSLLISLGTAQVVYACLSEMPPPVQGTMRGYYPGGRYYQLGADDFGSGTINWALRVLPGNLSAQGFDQTAASAPEGCRGVQFIADGRSGTGHWVGVDHARVTTADKARAVIETLVERMGSMIETLTPTQNQCNVIICGGGSQSEIWRNCLAHRLGCPLIRMKNVSPSAGAARMAREVLE